jgi:predicted Zn-dependent peptidase
VIPLAALLFAALFAGPTSGDAAFFPLTSAHVQAVPPDAGLRAAFDNGLRVLCVQNQGTCTVAVSAFVNTSARAETLATAGIRHFVARALIECSAADQPDIADRIQDLGADVFSGATLDLSQVTIGAAAEDVGAAAELLRDILFRARFNDLSLRRLRYQVASGLTAAGELPEVAAERAAAARLYPNHPFGWPVEGLTTTVGSFTTETVQSVYAQSYVPNNMVVVVAGGVPAEDSLRSVRAAFAGLLPGSRLPEATESPPPTQAGLEQFSRPSSTALVHIGARAPGLAEPTYPAATVALAVLGSGMGSRLYDALRRSDGVAYSFSAEARAAREGARAGVLAGCPPEKVDEAEGRVLLAIRRMTTELVSSEEIQRATEYISTGYAITRQRSADLAHQLGALEIAGGRGLELDRQLPRLVREVTPEQVRDASRAMFETKVRIRVMPS